MTRLANNRPVRNANMMWVVDVIDFMQAWFVNKFHIMKPVDATHHIASGHSAKNQTCYNLKFSAKRGQQVVETT
jgi:hypothetical protein